jgi:hypothetical protein
MSCGCSTGASWRSQTFKHVFERDDALTHGFQAFDAGRMGRPIAAQQRMFKRKRQMVYRHQADRCRNAGQRMGGARHGKSGGPRGSASSTP